ncbi:glycerophosphodiester phosphodiesterase [Halorubrum sp. 48-1-W]|uniref:glycerophosphodiester phosphodiesterase n=1 Tax=Halorubrum sp. 48-1-W TaxID=2249761 RepID=UPI000DCF0D56|nr:glycerophosphodiester phosphodiesterase [Halorubrum sp. 48-1-W]RAW44689.1 glycerophosphodiester phosphodiesterase [Halorubrum sp. 48-1-W]
MTRSDDPPRATETTPSTTDERETNAADETPVSRRRTLLAGTAGLATAGAVGLAYTDGGTHDTHGGTRDTTDTDREGASGTGTDPPEPREPGSGSTPTLIAHRGFAGENPENTVTAVEAAAGPDVADARRADLVEVDAVATADGDVVLFHDDRLSERAGGLLGLTDAEGLVYETDTETVTNAEVLDSGETVPLLRDVLEALPTDVGVNVELKNPGRGDLRLGEKLPADELVERTAVWRPFVERVCSVLDDYDNEVLLSSFYEAALAASREVSSYPLAPILSESVEDGLEIADAYDAEAIHPPIGMIRGTPFSEGTEDAGVGLVETAHAADCEVNVWTVETWYQALWLEAVGVDGIIADYAGLLGGH